MPDSAGRGGEGSAGRGAGPAPKNRAPAERELEALAERFRLPRSALSGLRSLLRLILSDPLAPTAIRDQGRALGDHLADSLVALEVDQVRNASRVADLGSGAGFPGLPLAIALPQAEFALIESAGRKAAFIERAVSECGITNASVVRSRIESWDEGAGHCDVVLARALAPLDVVSEYAAPLLRLGGLLVVWRGRRDPSAEEAGARAARILGLQEREVREVQPYPTAHQRHLHLTLKVKETPETFPRRPGVASKRRLGAG